jgi:phosphatidylglycerophosphatase A
MGTLGAIPLWWALSGLAAPAYLAVLALSTVLAVVAAHRAGRYWGVADASPIVVDEVVGYLFTMALVPFSWTAVAIGFLLFRILDVVKPWPASAFDRVKNGFGVVMDDVAAGLFARIGMYLLALLAGALP